MPRPFRPAGRTLKLKLSEAIANLVTGFPVSCRVRGSSQAAQPDRPPWMPEEGQMRPPPGFRVHASCFAKPKAGQQIAR
jgi:hypothetical protein